MDARERRSSASFATLLWQTWHFDSLEAVLQFDLDIGAQLDIIKAMRSLEFSPKCRNLPLSTSRKFGVSKSLSLPETVLSGLYGTQTHWPRKCVGRPLAFTTSCTSQLYRSTGSTGSTGSIQEIRVRIFRAVLLAALSSLSLLSFLKHPKVRLWKLIMKLIRTEFNSTTLPMFHHGTTSSHALTD